MIPSFDLTFIVLYVPAISLNALGKLHLIANCALILACLTTVYMELDLPSRHLDNSSPHSWHCSTQYHLVQSKLVGYFSLEWLRKPPVVNTCMVTGRTYLLTMSPSKCGLGCGHSFITIALGNLT